MTLDGTDVELTRFVEWFESKWLVNHLTTLNISNILWDNGHDTLRFETNCDILQLGLQVQAISAKFPTMFIMYDFYTGEDEENYHEEVMWFYQGKMQSAPNVPAAK
jgi:hypothetical protein